MNFNKIVTRFAPSPTGYMHIGNLRTALYAYLIAKSNNGKFILRIEDTDRERLIEEAVDVIYDTLKLANLCYDEGPDIGGENGPYIQSERTAIYKKYAKKLIDMGKAYYCFCGKERLSTLHEESDNHGYDRHCRHLSEVEIIEKLESGIPFVIRQKVPDEGLTTYTDSVFGDITVDNSELQDNVLIKTDGFPTYNFAHVVDDYLMGVNCVVRGSEYISSTPSYALLYDSFGWERPKYVHLPLILGKNPDGSVSKLSKRHGAVSFQDLIKDGYLPEAIINYIALLGWSPKDTNDEIFSLNEITKKFDIKDISKSPSVFDYEKLLWFNGSYIRNLSMENFKNLAVSYMPSFSNKDINFDKIIRLIQPRIEKLSQIPGMVGFFEEMPEYNCDIFINKKNKVTMDIVSIILESSLELLEKIEHWGNDELFDVLKNHSDNLNIKSGAVMWVIRIAISGMAVTPGGATEILEIIGKQESIKRLKCSLKKIK